MNRARDSRTRLWGGASAVFLAEALVIPVVEALRRSGAIFIFLLVLFAAKIAILVPLREIHDQMNPRYASALEIPLWMGFGVRVTQPPQGTARRGAWAALSVLALWLGSTPLRTYVLASPGWYAPGEAARRARERVAPDDGFVFFPTWLAKPAAAEAVP